MHALIGKTPYTLELGLQAAVSLASSLCVYVVSMAYGIFMPFFPDLVPSVILGRPCKRLYHQSVIMRFIAHL